MTKEFVDTLFEPQTFQDREYLPTDDLVSAMRYQMYQMLTVAQTHEKQVADTLLEAVEIGLTVMNIELWMFNRNLHKPEYQEAQLTKLWEEVEELNTNVLMKQCCLDDCGDVMVVAIGAAMRNGNSGREALLQAFNDIKDRKGRMIDGVFVKEQDL